MMDNLIILHLMVCEQKENNELHVTSINYDNDIAMDLVKQVKVQSQFMDVLVKMKLLISVVKITF